MERSILRSVKSKLNIDPSYDVFDSDIIDYINSVFVTLNQLNVGPIEPFFIEDETAVWDDFSTENPINMVKTYIYDKVRLMFDPPTNSFHVEAINKRINEAEWRMNSEVDY